MTRKLALPLLNVEEARFECTFGRGCDGLCCKEGKPPLFRDEVERLDANLDKVLPRLRPEARAVVEKKGYLDLRSEPDRPYLRVVAGWCVFFNQGCVLHTLGAEEGDKDRYKPRECIWFPLTHDKKGNWYVRQQGYLAEPWDLFCLDPANSRRRAAETLHDETEAVRRFQAERAAAR